MEEFFSGEAFKCGEPVGEETECCFGGGGVVPYVDAVDPYGSGIGAKEAGGDGDGGRFASAVRAHKPVKTAAGDIDV